MNGEKGTPYWKKLKDPRWQKRRLEVLARDGFKCVGCGATSETLHVHHLVYRKGVEPWEAPMDDMVTVCERCHEVAEDKEVLLGFRKFMTLGIHLESLREVSKAMSEFSFMAKDGFPARMPAETIFQKLRDDLLFVDAFEHGYSVGEVSGERNASTNNRGRI